MKFTKEIILKNTLRAIAARENCLKQVREVITKLDAEEENLGELAQNIVIEKVNTILINKEMINMYSVQNF